MINYLTHDQIDKRLWDACVGQAPNGNSYAWSWYLDIAHPGWEALVECIGGKYLTVMPLTGKKKYGIHYLCQPFFVQQLGVFSVMPLTPARVQEFLEAIPQKYRLIEINLNEGNPLPEAFPGVQYHRTCLLDLQHDYHTLFSNYHENTKRNLKKSLKYSLRLEKEAMIEKIIALFRADRGATVKHWKDEEYHRLLDLARASVVSSNALVYSVQKDDNEELICGGIFLFTHKRITFLFSGNSAEGKRVQAMTFLLDQVVREFSNRPLTLDFEGSDDENLARYYLGFGAREQKYPSYHCYMPKVLYLCTKL